MVETNTMKSWSRRLSAALLVGCGVISGPARAADCKGPAETTDVSFMSDWLPWADEGPMVAANVSGFYKQEGLNVTLLSPANAADPIKLVARQKVDFSLTFVPEIMMSRETGIPVVSVATTLRVLSSGLASTAEENITKPSDLKGKTIGVSPKLDAQAYLATLLAAGGLTTKDVNVVDPGYAIVPLVLSGRLAAAHALTIAEGVVINQELQKQNRKPAHWLMYTDYGVPHYYYQVIAANETWAKQHSNTVCHFLHATQKGLDAWLADPQPALNEMIKQNDAFTPEQHRAIFEVTKDQWKTKEGVALRQDVAVWKEAQDWAIKEKFLTVPSDPQDYFTNDYLQ
jgi:putative hydroxymethylpyrimidine transport system substrate-binding protein